MESREQARSLIMEGKVIVNGSSAVKAGTFVKNDSAISILQTNPYVSRGGLKLEAALKAFDLPVKGLTALDAGASTGGFTDCLLHHGAKKIYAVDVGYGQFSWKLRNDPRVELLEKTNIRTLAASEIGEEIDIAVIDVSFISLVKVLPRVWDIVTPGGAVLALIKPQFEVFRKDIGKGGVVKSNEVRAETVKKISLFCRDHGCDVNGTFRSPLKGPKGNVEFFILMRTSVDLSS